MTKTLILMQNEVLNVILREIGFSPRSRFSMKQQRGVTVMDHVTLGSGLFSSETEKGLGSFAWVKKPVSEYPHIVVKMTPGEDRVHDL